MKMILSGVVRLYWLLIPANRRRRCLFRETCSRYVYRITQEQGGRAGWQALKERLRQCQPHYQLINDGDHYALRLKDGSMLPEQDIARHLLPYTKEYWTIPLVKLKKRKTSKWNATFAKTQ